MDMAATAVSKEAVDAFAELMMGLDIADRDARHQAIAKLTAGLLAVFMACDEDMREKLTLAFDFNNTEATKKLEALTRQPK